MGKSSTKSTRIVVLESASTDVDGSKFAVSGFSEALKVELDRYNIGVWL